MAADIDNVKLGVCSVSFDGVDLGHTKGGVTVEVETIYHDTMVDKYGESPVKKFAVGQKMRAVVPLAESTIANLVVGLPAGTDGTTKLTVGGQAGTDLTSLAKQLVLHPIANASNNLSEDVVIYKAISSQPVELPFMVDDERVFEVTFDGLIDESRSDGDQMGLIGDSTT